MHHGTMDMQCVIILSHIHILKVFFEGHHVRDAYWKFLADVSNYRMLHINIRGMDYFGTNASIRQEQFIHNMSASRK